MARITIISLSTIDRDARVLRQAQRLAVDHTVTVVGYGKLSAQLEGRVRMQSLPEPEAFIRRNLRDLPKLAAGRVAPRLGYDAWYWGRRDHRAALDAVLASHPQLVLANDWTSLPVAARAREQLGARVVLDLHEYAPSQWDNRRIWMALVAPMVDFTLRRYQQYVDAFITVGETIARRYASEYGFEPTVILNAPDASGAPNWHPTGEIVHLVHHGGATRERHLETLIAAVGALGRRFHLHLILVGSDRRYRRELEDAAGRHPGLVSFHPAVTPDAIVAEISKYDMGFYLLPPVNYNSHAALPNKFFDFVAAGCAVCVGPSPEMARLTHEHGFGVVCDGFSADDAVRALASLEASDIDRMKQAAVSARSCIDARSQMDILEGIVNQVLAR